METSNSIERPLPVPDAARVRTSLQVTLAVWKALFLREAVSRLSAGRMAWLWILLEPIFQVVLIMAVFTLLRMRIVPGGDTAIWLMVGVLGFSLVRDPVMRCLDAITVNIELFAYRQVKPVDIVLVRGGLEAFLNIIVTVLLMVSVGMIGYDVIPHNPLDVLLAFVGLWLAGVGMALPFSVAAELIPEVRRLVQMGFVPLYWLSGVIYPLFLVPPEYRDWLLAIPITHGIEVLRRAYFPYYHTDPDISLLYLYGASLVGVFLGLALHVRYAERLKAR